MGRPISAAAASDASLVETTRRVIEFDISRQTPTLIYALGVMAILIALGGFALLVILKR